MIKPTEESAEAYAHAFQVILELRACDGVVEPKENISQWLVDLTEDSAGIVPVRFEDDLWAKLGHCFSPCFDTEENAQAALDKVGEDRILQAMKTLAGVK